MSQLPALAAASSEGLTRSHEHKIARRGEHTFRDAARCKGWCEPSAAPMTMPIAVARQRAKQEKAQKSAERASSLAAARAEREEAKRVAKEKADIARKEKQEAIAQRIEVITARERAEERRDVIGCRSGVQESRKFLGTWEREGKGKGSAGGFCSRIASLFPLMVRIPRVTRVIIDEDFGRVALLQPEGE